MAIVVKLIGISIIIISASFACFPQIMRKYVAFWKPGKRIFLGGMLSIVIGVIFMLASTYCWVKEFIFAVGVVSFLKGFIILILSKNKLKSMLAWWDTLESTILRLLGMCGFFFGVLVVYAV